MNEERILYFNGYRARLAYEDGGRSAMLRLEHDSGQDVVIRSDSIPMAPEQIYELLRKCEVNWRTL